MHLWCSGGGRECSGGVARGSDAGANPGGGSACRPARRQPDRGPSRCMAQPRTSAVSPSSARGPSSGAWSRGGCGPARMANQRVWWPAGSSPSTSMAFASGKVCREEGRTWTGCGDRWGFAMAKPRDLRTQPNGCRADSVCVKAAVEATGPSWARTWVCMGGAGLASAHCRRGRHIAIAGSAVRSPIAQQTRHSARPNSHWPAAALAGCPAGLTRLIYLAAVFGNDCIPSGPTRQWHRSAADSW